MTVWGLTRSPVADETRSPHVDQYRSDPHHPIAGSVVELLLCTAGNWMDYQSCYPTVTMCVIFFQVQRRHEGCWMGTF